MIRVVDQQKALYLEQLILLSIVVTARVVRTFVLLCKAQARKVNGHVFVC